MEISTVVYRCLLMLFLWLSSQACMEDERAALLEIKSSINYPEGTSFSNWYGEYCCLWEGLECDASTTRVIKIFFPYKRDRSLPPWYPNMTLFSQFKDLQELELPGNQIGGFTSPQELRKLKSLQILDLHDNVIKKGSIFCWGELPSLSSLDASHNKLTGNFPGCICENLSLRELDLSENDLAGHIHSCFSNMTLLEHVDLSGNLFNSIFPSSLIRNLTNVESLIVSRNLFEGVVSFSAFANLSSLKCLDMSYNRLRVEETDGPTMSPSFKLNVLKLSGCNLTNVPSFLSAQHELRTLDLSYNLLQSVPSWLLYNVTEEVRIRGNNLSGPLPRLLQNISSQLAALDISDNFFYGSLPEDIGVVLPRLHYLNVSTNGFSGNLSPSLGRMKQLQKLDLSSNQFTGEIPDSMTSNMSMLELLDLSNNNLRGEAIARNSSLPNLRWLQLNGNSFTGTFPNSLSESRSLVLVSIQDNVLSGELSSHLPFLPQLRWLFLGGNRLEGEIPRQLCQMRHLRILDLSTNRLSGDIPRCLGNVSSWTEETYSDIVDSPTKVKFRLKGMVVTFLPQRPLSIFSGIDVSCNQLTGVIPAEISQMKSILVLNMSHNILTGQIPASFHNLQELESLDLSHNQFSGTLPQELTNMDFLGVFNVSFNNLSGKIPQGRQFNTFLNDSYMGNPGLCDPPLAKQCSEVVAAKAYGHEPNFLPVIMGCCVLFIQSWIMFS